MTVDGIDALNKRAKKWKGNQLHMARLNKSISARIAELEAKLTTKDEKRQFLEKSYDLLWEMLTRTFNPGDEDVQRQFILSQIGTKADFVEERMQRSLFL